MGHNHMVRGCALPHLFRWRGPGGGEVLTLCNNNNGALAPLPREPMDLYGLSASRDDGPDLPAPVLWTAISYGENWGPEGVLQRAPTLHRLPGKRHLPPLSPFVGDVGFLRKCHW